MRWFLPLPVASEHRPTSSFPPSITSHHDASPSASSKQLAFTASGRMPPTARLPASRALQGINKVLQDRSLIEQLRKLNNESEFFDYNGPSVRERRSMTRANFDFIMSTEYNGMYSPLYQVEVPCADNYSSHRCQRYMEPVDHY